MAKICLLTLEAVRSVDWACDALVLLACPYASATLLPCHLSGDGLRILSLQFHNLSYLISRSTYFSEFIVNNQIKGFEQNLRISKRAG